MGTNCQEYVPFPNVSFSTPNVLLLRTSLLGSGVLKEYSPPPPVPTTNARIPRWVSS